MKNKTQERLIPFSSIVEANGKTIKENNMAKGHNIPVGTLVEVRRQEWFGDGACEISISRMFVAEHGRDCDGTPLYWLSSRYKSRYAREIYARDILEYIFGHKTNKEKKIPDLVVNLFDKLCGGYREEHLTPIEITPEIIDGHESLDVKLLDGIETIKEK